MNFTIALFNFFKTHISWLAAVFSFVAFMATIIGNPVAATAPYLAELAVKELPGITAVTIDAYGFVNYFVPLTELFNMVVVWVPLYVLVSLIRTLKSLIPFLN